uniref:HAT C-terminal dimerisation domain-containing protein n=1 Tax=Lactuca sativa TaxID=4236 RepID=A0A9R1XH75_LACSA|nr:hypothetical protein LSAT_V11C400181680 [Lactuca sativa]
MNQVIRIKTAIKVTVLVQVSDSSSFSSRLSFGHRVVFKKLLFNDDESRGMSELDNYLEEKLLLDNYETTSYWKTNGFLYMTLQRIVKDILDILVSTVASESAFSTCGRLVSPHRSRIHMKIMEDLMCDYSFGLVLGFREKFKPNEIPFRYLGKDGNFFISSSKMGYLALSRTRLIGIPMILSYLVNTTLI